jgi:hypothetical protein
LPDGVHEFRVRATDEAGNREATAYTWTIDTGAPVTTIGERPADPTKDTSASFTFAAGERAEFECALDTGAFVACGTPLEYTGLTEGEHTFRVRATDRAGNHGEPATYPWTIDTTAPDTTIDERPPASTTRTSARFTFTADGPATLECALDTADYAPCTSPVEHSGLALGTHGFRVRATDTAGNTDASAAIHVWTVSVGDESAAPASPGPGPGGPTGGGGAAPQPPAGGTEPDTRAPDLKLRAPISMRASALRRGGAKLAVTASEDGRIVAQLRTAGGRVLARANAAARAGQRTFVRLRARGMAGRRLTLRITAVDLAGNRRTISRHLRVTVG